MVRETKSGGVLPAPWALPRTRTGQGSALQFCLIRGFSSFVAHCRVVNESRRLDHSRAASPWLHFQGGGDEKFCGKTNGSTGQLFIGVKFTLLYENTILVRFPHDSLSTCDGDKTVVIDGV